MKYYYIVISLSCVAFYTFSMDFHKDSTTLPDEVVLEFMQHSVNDYRQVTFINSIKTLLKLGSTNKQYYHVSRSDSLWNSIFNHPKAEEHFSAIAHRIEPDNSIAKHFYNFVVAQHYVTTLFSRKGMYNTLESIQYYDPHHPLYFNNYLKSTAFKDFDENSLNLLAVFFKACCITNTKLSHALQLSFASKNLNKDNYHSESCDQSSQRSISCSIDVQKFEDCLPAWAYDILKNTENIWNKVHGYPLQKDRKQSRSFDCKDIFLSHNLMWYVLLNYALKDESSDHIDQTNLINACRMHDYTKVKQLLEMYNYKYALINQCDMLGLNAPHIAINNHCKIVVATLLADKTLYSKSEWEVLLHMAVDAKNSYALAKVLEFYEPIDYIHNFIGFRTSDREILSQAFRRAVDTDNNNCCMIQLFLDKGLVPDACSLTQFYYTPEHPKYVFIKKYCAKNSLYARLLSNFS